MILADRFRRLFARPYSTITAGRAQELMQQGAVLLDVRAAFEWNSGHASNARHIPLDALSSRLGELPTSRPVVAICQSGLRSARAARLLAAHGFEVYNLRGGMRAWTGARPTSQATGDASHPMRTVTHGAGRPERRRARSLPLRQ